MYAPLGIVTVFGGPASSFFSSSLLPPNPGISAFFSSDFLLPLF
jgi:hypothetical protein